MFALTYCNAMTVLGYKKDAWQEHLLLEMKVGQMCLLKASRQMVAHAWSDTIPVIGVHGTLLRRPKLLDSVVWM